jgi:DNA adenine methylase
MKLKPFMKCPGGKTKLLKVLLPLVPKNYNRYIEPFIGGGALFFALQPKNAIINDIIYDIGNSYYHIKHSIEDLLYFLQEHKSLHCDNYYYKIRNSEYKNQIEKAARWIYLNKTCFNGLIRFNKQGKFNVPIGDYNNPKIFDYSLLRNISKYLNNNDIKICNENYTQLLYGTGKGDFIYFDPPYHPISETSNFTSYNGEKFTLANQIELKEWVDELTKKDVQCMITNSYCKEMLELWKDYKIQLIDSRHTIAAAVSSRKILKEIVVINY